jgi:hypothetical protein
LPLSTKEVAMADPVDVGCRSVTSAIHFWYNA